MIFSATYAQVLAGTKTQTTRLAKPGDRLDKVMVETPGVRQSFPVDAVLSAASRVRWRVGAEYAVQPGRDRRAVGRIVCASLTAMADPTTAGRAFAEREGFASVAAFAAVWRELHGAGPYSLCWAIGAELV